MSNADIALMGFGAALALIGVALFARTKVTGDNSMRVLGMQVQVSHPSLLIFFSGVVLMLAPRLLPEGSNGARASAGPVEAGLGPAPPGADADQAGAAYEPPDDEPPLGGGPRPGHDRAPDRAPEGEPAFDEPDPDGEFADATDGRFVDRAANEGGEIVGDAVENDGFDDPPE